MNHGRKQSFLNNLTAVARKVYDAVPIQERWSILQMSNEMHRLGTRISWPILSGILNDLASQKLIHTNAQDVFWRDADEKEPARQLISKPCPIDFTQQETATMPFDVLTELSNISAKLRGDAAALNERADRIDDIALKAADAIKEAGAGGEELVRLKAVLKGIMS